MLNAYKAVLFDAGGTLVRPYPSVGEVYRRVAAGYGCHASAALLEELFREVWKKHDGMISLAGHVNEQSEKDWWRQIVKEVFDGIGEMNDFEAFFSDLYETFAAPDTWRLYEEVPEVLVQLKSRGYRLGIVSNWDSRLPRICEGLKLDQFFDFILASAVFGCAKPDPGIFREAVARAGTQPSETVHIGDSLKDDVCGAHGAGIHAILIDRSNKKRQFDNADLPVFPVVENLSELIR